MRQRAISFALTTILTLLALCGGVRAQDNPPPQGGQINALLTTACGAGVSSCVVKAAPGNLYGFLVYCSAACWVIGFNSTALPTNGAYTTGTGAGNGQFCHAASAAGVVEHDWPTYPMNFSVGITIAISSTACGTLTAATTGTITGTYK